MKNAKRILCLALTCLMVLSSVGVFASFSDVPESVSYAQAVSSLSQLGIITGYEDGTFKPDNDVTRAEFCAMLMRTMGYGSIGSTSSEGLPFTDVSDTNSDISWAIPNIATAYKMGIVNGYEDSTFKPSANVAYEEAVKMVVCALGYGQSISVDVTPWYANFMTQASSIGILKNAQNLGSAEKPASRACIAQMLYDALEVPLVENSVLTSKTLLSDYLGYIKGTGYVSSNGRTSLEDPDVNLRDNQIQIRAKEPNSSVYEVHTYTTDKVSDFTDKLGYQLDFYYPKSNSNEAVRTLFSYDFKENTSIELTSTQIEKDDSTNTSIKYYPSETANKTSITLAADNIVIYNGKLYGTNASDSVFTLDMLPTVGTATFLDSDKDGRYDMITIWDYEVYYVTSKSSSDYSIVDSTTRVLNKTLKLDAEVDDNLEIVDKNGSKVSFSSIATGNVICYAESNHAENGGLPYKRAVVLSDKATGTVSTVVSGDELKIGSTIYKFSDAAPWMNDGNDNTELTEPKAGDSGTYALDIIGNVFAYSKQAEASSSYGYVVAYNTDSSTAFPSLSDLQIRVLTQSGTKTDFHVYKGTSINGETISSANDVIETLRDSASFQNTGDTEYTNIQQVIKYTTTTHNGYNCLDSIYTVTNSSYVSGGQTIENDKLYYDSRFSHADDLTYSSSRLTSDSGLSLSVSSAIVFNVPSDNERNDSDKFSKSANWTRNKEYTVEAFDVSTANAARVVVVYGGSSATEINEYSPLYVIENMGQSHNSSTGEIMYNADGYKVTTSSSSSFSSEWISTESNSIMKKANIGDIYRAGTDSDGYTLFDSNYVVYSDSIKGRCYMETNEKNKNDWFEGEYTVIYGSVYSSDSVDGMVIVPEYIEEGDELSDSATQYTIPKSSFSSSKIIAYSDTNNGLELIDKSSDRDSVLEELNAYADNTGLAPAKVVVYMYYGQVKLMAVTEGY